MVTAPRQLTIDIMVTAWWQLIIEIMVTAWWQLMIQIMVTAWWQFTIQIMVTAWWQLAIEIMVRQLTTEIMEGSLHPDPVPWSESRTCSETQVSFHRVSNRLPPAAGLRKSGRLPARASHTSLLSSVCRSRRCTSLLPWPATCPQPPPASHHLAMPACIPSLAGLCLHCI